MTGSTPPCPELDAYLTSHKCTYVLSAARANHQFVLQLMVGIGHGRIRPHTEIQLSSLIISGVISL